MMLLLLLKLTSLNIPGYKLISINRPDNTAHGRVTVFIELSLEFYEFPDFYQDYSQYCITNLKLNFTQFTITVF